MSRSRQLSVVVAVIVSLSIAACGADGLDVRALEADLVARLLPARPGLVDAVQCPPDADPVADEKIVCTASIGTQQVEVPVLFSTAADGETLVADAEIGGRLVAIDEVATLLATSFTEEITLATTVDCGPDPVLVVPDDKAVRCVATDPRGIERVFAVAIDNTGALSLVLL